MDAAPEVLAAAEASGVRESVVLGVNLLLGAVGLYLWKNRKRGALGRNSHKVKLWRTGGADSALLLACICLDAFVLPSYFPRFVLFPFFVTFLAMLVLMGLRPGAYPNLAGEARLSFPGVCAEAARGLLRLWPVLLAAFFLSSVVFAGFPKQRAVEQVANAAPEQLFLLLVNVVLVAPLLEEIVFRGFFYRTLKGSLGMGPAMVASSLLFALVHKNALVFAPLMVLAAALVLAYERTGDLRVPIMMHAFFNAFNCGAILFLHG